MLNVYHLGRSGEIAGGMTQVLNDYLEWTFPESQQHVIISRASGRVASLARLPAARRQISALARRAPESVIVAHVSQGGSFLREGALAVHARRRGLPVVVHVHGSTFPSFARDHPRLVRHVLRHAHVVIVLSSESADAVRSIPEAPEPIIIPNGVSDGPTAIREPAVVFAGAISRRKGVDTLLEAWRRGAPKGWRLVLAGPPREPDLLTDLPATVTAPGALDRAEVRTLLARGRIAVLPSTDEAMPLFVLEALAAGTVVVATPVGAVADVLADACGVIVPVGDVSALGTALRTLAADDRMRDVIAERGRAAWEENYSPQAIIPLLEAAWRRASLLAGQ